MAKLLGKDLLLIVGGEVVGMAKDCTIEYTSDTIEVSSPSSGTARDFIPGRTAWTATCSRLIPADVSMVGLRSGFFMQVGKILEMQLWPRGKSAATLGNAICTKCTVTAQVGQMAQGSFAFQGSGKLMGL